MGNKSLIVPQQIRKQRKKNKGKKWKKIQKRKMVSWNPTTSKAILKLSSEKNATYILQVWFQTNEIKWVSQYNMSQKIFGYPVYIIVMFTL